jgi:hypothetical protein
MSRIITEQDLLDGVVLPREQAVEVALSWAAQQNYSFASDALTSYCTLRNLLWSSDAMYGYITFKVQSFDECAQCHIKLSSTTGRTDLLCEYHAGQ